jgi:FkbM family methyltransferase
MEVLSSYPSIRKLKLFVRKKLLKAMMANSSGLFIRGNDKISQVPLLGEIYEPNISSLMSHGTKNGYNEFLIDIGANIGLTTCQEGSNFEKVICYEPNHLLYEILKTNIALSRLSNKVMIFKYGLGETEGNFQIKMPKDNLGAGFVENKDNSYSASILARKDNCSDLEFRDYLKQDIEIKNAKKSLLQNFEYLRGMGYSRGIIKIDVEGMEASIIRSLLKVVPSSFSLLVVFENHNPQLSVQELMITETSSYAHDLRLLELITEEPYSHRAPIVYKGIRSLFGTTKIVTKDTIGFFVPTGTLLLILESKV